MFKYRVSSVFLLSGSYHVTYLAREALVTTGIALWVIGNTNLLTMIRWCTIKEELL
jgi:hypothetical protein